MAPSQTSFLSLKHPVALNSAGAFRRRWTALRRLSLLMSVWCQESNPDPNPNLDPNPVRVRSPTLTLSGVRMGLRAFRRTGQQLVPSKPVMEPEPSREVWRSDGTQSVQNVDLGARRRIKAGTQEDLRLPVAMDTVRGAEQSDKLKTMPSSGGATACWRDTVASLNNSRRPGGPYRW